jgi:hypothetical protein
MCVFCIRFQESTKILRYLNTISVRISALAKVIFRLMYSYIFHKKLIIRQMFIAVT